jgi:hypothetical protein
MELAVAQELVVLQGQVVHQELQVLVVFRETNT